MSGYLGIDPGKQGAIAWIWPSGVSVISTPLLTRGEGRAEYDLTAVAEALQGIRASGTPIALAMVEKLRALPPVFKGAGGREIHGGSLANFGRGESRGWAWMLTALGIPYQLVEPQAWQKAMLAGTPKTADTKARSIMAAQRLFPRVSLVPLRCRKASDGYADALLLAEYARRVHSGGELFAAAERAQTSAAVEPEDVFEARG